jgi:hypothetical protein
MSLYDPPFPAEKFSRLHASLFTLWLRPRRMFFVAAFLASAALLWLFYVADETLYLVSPVLQNPKTLSIVSPPPHLDPLNPLASLNGPPTMKFRGLRSIPFFQKRKSLDVCITFTDNLRNDTKYITSWLNAGWSAYSPMLAKSLKLTLVHL